MKTSVSKKQLREFGILFGFGMPFLFGWIFPTLSGHNFKIWTLFIGIFSLFLSILNPYLLLYPYKGWMKIGLVLGWLNSRLILGLIFLIILQPIALIMRLFSHDPLKIRTKNKYSYRENKKNYRIDLTKIF